MSEFSENLKLCRMCAGVTQDYVAKKINKANPTYRHYERAYCEPNHKTLIKLSQLFGVTLNDLLGVTND